MSKKDNLKEGANKCYVSTNTGSYKTRYNHLRESHRFVDELRKCGSGVQKWSNVTNKHVSMVVDSWQERGLSTATIKENLSGVRAVAAFFGNNNICAKNSDFGIQNRIYVTNADKSVPQHEYERVVNELKSSDNINDHRVAVQLQMMRELGLRKEESFKIHPARVLLNDNRVLISDGTKGGRDRIIHETTNEQKNVLNDACMLAGKNGNTMPENTNERKWEKVFYRTLAAHGFTKKSCGASSHGLRHAYAQDRYEKITGFKSPCKFDSKVAFREAAIKAVGEEWKKADQDARLIIKSELGHGPDRDDVVSQYLGSR